MNNLRTRSYSVGYEDLKIPPIKSESPCLIVRLSQKIYDSVINIFHFFKRELGINKLLGQHEIKFLRNDMNPTQLDPALKNRITHPAQISPSPFIPSSQMENPSSAQSQSLYERYDDSLEAARELTRKTAKKIYQELHAQKIKPALEKVEQSANTIPPIIKSFAELLIEMGDKAAKPLFQKLTAEKMSAIDPALKKALGVLMRVEKNKNLKAQLILYLKKEIKSVVLPSTHSPQQYIRPIVAWMFNGENKTIADFHAHDHHLDDLILHELQLKAKNFCDRLKMQTLTFTRENIQNKIAQDLKGIQPPFRKSLNNDYITPILDWIFDTDHSEALASKFSPLIAYDEDLIDQVFEASISGLIEWKIDYYVNILEDTMQSRLNEIVQRTMEINLTNICNFISGRLSDLIQNMPYTQTYERIIKDVLSKHVDAYLKAVQSKEEQKKTLDRVQQVVAIEAKNEQELKLKEMANLHLDSVEKQGGKKHFLENMFLEEFSKQDGCNPNIKQMISQRLTSILQGKSGEAAVKVIENSVAATLAEELISLILPPQNRSLQNGLIIEERDALVVLWERLYLPPEFHTLVTHIGQLAEEFISSDTIELFSNVKQPFMELQEKAAVAVGQTLLKKHLTAFIQNILETLTAPEKLDKLNAEILFPAINEQLLVVFAENEIDTNLKMLLPKLHAFFHANPEEKQKALRSLSEEIARLLSGDFHQLNRKNFFISFVKEEGKTVAKFSDLTDKALIEIIENAMINLEEELKRELGEVPQNSKKLASALSHHFKNNCTKSDPIYGDLVLKVLGKIGGLNVAWGLEGISKKIISRALTNAMQKISSSHHYLVDKVVSIADKKIFGPPKCEECTYNDEPVPEETAKKLAHQQNTMTSMIYDLSMHIAQSKAGSLGKMGVTWMLKNDNQRINWIITNIYQLCQNKLLNKSVLLQCASEVFKSFATSAQTIRNRDNLKYVNTSALS